MVCGRDTFRHAGEIGEIVIVYDLCCSHGHRFEGWFRSAEDFDAQQRAEMVGCPVCSDHCVSRRPSASRLNLGAAAPRRAAPPGATEGESRTDTAGGSHPRALLERMRRALDERFENVGERFAEEARRIHYGESESRAIRGLASGAEVRALHEEGIEALALMPATPDKGKMN